MLSVAAAAALLVAGCGGGGKSPNVANLSTTGSSTTTTTSSATTSGSIGPQTSSGRNAPSGARAGFAIAGNNPQQELKLSVCMRAHGVPNFPDPNSAGVIQGNGIDPTSPQFQAAMKDCSKYAPNGGKPPSPAQQAHIRAQAIKYSECMRSHGVTNFPDPQFPSGGGVRISLGGGPGTGLDPSSPAFQRAQTACESDLPGKAGKLRIGPIGSKQ